MQRTTWLCGLCVVCLLLGPTTSRPVAAQQEFTLTLTEHRFRPAEVRVPAHTPFILTIVNEDKDDEEFEISTLRIEKIIPGGKTLQLQIPALKAGTYEFVGEFHEKTAQGRISAE